MLSSAKTLLTRPGALFISCMRLLQNLQELGNETPLHSKVVLFPLSFQGSSQGQGVISGLSLSRAGTVQASEIFTLSSECNPLNFFIAFMLLRSTSIFEKIINCYSSQENETGSTRVTQRNPQITSQWYELIFYLATSSEKSREIILGWL